MSKFVPNSMDDPNRKIVENGYCEIHDEIIIYRPSVNPNAEVPNMIEIKKCKCGCWEEK